MSAIVYVLSYRYKEGGEEFKQTVLTVTQVQQQIEFLLRGARAVEYIRISPRYI